MAFWICISCPTLLSGGPFKPCRVFLYPVQVKACNRLSNGPTEGLVGTSGQVGIEMRDSLVGLLEEVPQPRQRSATNCFVSPWSPAGPIIPGIDMPDSLVGEYPGILVGMQQTSGGHPDGWCQSTHASSHCLVGPRFLHAVWWGFFTLSGGSLGVLVSQVGLLAPKTQVCMDCLVVLLMTSGFSLQVYGNHSPSRAWWAL